MGKQIIFQTLDKRSKNVNGTCLQEYTTHSYDNLVGALGEPTCIRERDETDEYKTHVEWHVDVLHSTFDDQVYKGTVTIYDYKEKRDPRWNSTNNVEWHVGAKSSGLALDFVSFLNNEKMNNFRSSYNTVTSDR